VDCDAAQCGYCIPGFVLMSKELLTENPTPSEKDITEHLEGNICRCGTYPEIKQAVAAAAERRAGRGPCFPYIPLPCLAGCGNRSSTGSPNRRSPWTPAATVSPHGTVRRSRSRTSRPTSPR